MTPTTACSSFSVTNAVVQHVHDIFEKRFRKAETTRLARVEKVLALAGVTQPAKAGCNDGNDSTVFNRDQELQRAMSELVRRKQLSLVGLIQVWRDESEIDSWQNRPWMERGFLIYTHTVTRLSTLSNMAFCMPFLIAKYPHRYSTTTSPLGHYSTPSDAVLEKAKMKDRTSSSTWIRQSDGPVSASVRMVVCPKPMQILASKPE